MRERGSTVPTAAEAVFENVKFSQDVVVNAGEHWFEPAHGVRE